MMVYVKDAKDSISFLGGGSIMESLIGLECKIIELSSNEKSIHIESETNGSWWFLPSDLIDTELETEPNIFHFDVVNL